MGTALQLQARPLWRLASFPHTGSQMLTLHRPTTAISAAEWGCVTRSHVCRARMEALPFAESRLNNLPVYSLTRPPYRLALCTEAPSHLHTSKLGLCYHFEGRQRKYQAALAHINCGGRGHPTRVHGGPAEPAVPLPAELLGGRMEPRLGGAAQEGAPGPLSRRTAALVPAALLTRPPRRTCGRGCTLQRTTGQRRRPTRVRSPAWHSSACAFVRDRPALLSLSLHR